MHHGKAQAVEAVYFKVDLDDVSGRRVTESDGR